MLKGKQIGETLTDPKIREIPSTLGSTPPTSPIVLTPSSPNQSLTLGPTLETITKEME
jgi:hypothetical protein